MRILVIEMIYLFEYDDNEEDMIYEIEIIDIVFLGENNDDTFYRRNIVIYVEEYVFEQV